MGMLFMAHSGVRYLVLVAAVIALALSLMKGQDSNARKAMGAFVGAIDVQVLLGLLLIMQIPFYGALMGHIAMMFAAVFAAHYFSVAAKKKEDGGMTRVIGIVVTLVLVVLGIMAIGRPIFGSSMM
jgi:small-conductance mechanosensitive channel